MVVLELVSVDSIDKLSDNHISKCVEEQAEMKNEYYDLLLIEQEIRNFKMIGIKSRHLEYRIR